MIKKLVWLVCGLVLTTAIAGCQLAKGDADIGKESLPDRLAGVFITFEPLTNTKPVYALAKEATAADGYTYTAYEFPGFEGILFFHLQIAETSASEPYSTSIISPEILEATSNIHIHDEGEDVTLSGKIFNLVSSTMYFNQVYQDGAGDVYVVSGGPGYYSGEGAIWNVTFEETSEVIRTEAGVSQKENYTIIIKVAVEQVDTPVEVIFKEMNDQDEVINTTRITPDSIPDSLSWRPDCSYVLVIARSDRQASRAILSADEASYIFKYAGEKGCLVGEAINLDPANPGRP